MRYYFSLQYSAIQKTVLRHDRLWSIAGISNLLAHLNEIEFPDIVNKYGGTPIVAGGGKFTAYFPDKPAADNARLECEQSLATALPMMEFQISKNIWSAPSFKALVPEDKATDRINPAIAELNDQKRQFRGYGVSFNPHLKLCDECGEYPAAQRVDREKKNHLCRICSAAFGESQKLSRKKNVHTGLTTLQRVYDEYLTKVSAMDNIRPSADFNDLFPVSKNDNKDNERKRMAVWFSDLNNMNDKVPIWLRQDNEDNIRNTFTRFRNSVVKIIVDALVETFPRPKGNYLPFRLVVAGGDDLTLVMTEQDILHFATNISKSLNAEMEGLERDDPEHPLTIRGLRKLSDDPDYSPKPFGFGASFVVTSIHTPFSQIHSLGEDLMSEAKRATGRKGNSVNWQIMAEDRPLDKDPFPFDRPLLIDNKDAEPGELSLNRYMELRQQFAGKLSGAHMQQIVGIMMRETNPFEIERQMKLLDSSEADKSFSRLLRDPVFREGGDVRKSLLPKRLSTLFELLRIGGVKHD